jgi:DNA-binding NarL/FixJ family response regulator
MLSLLIVEDNEKLRAALKRGFEQTGTVRVLYDCPTGEAALRFCKQQVPQSILMDVQLAGEMNGIETIIAIRREWPRMPAVFYSIQDDDAYYRAFRQSGILSHYAYVRKSNFLLPEMIVPLLTDAVAGRSYIDPDIENRVEEVRDKDAHAPLDLLEPAERTVATLLGQGLTNKQIAARMGFRDKRTVSRINGQIYATWGLNNSTTDEKVARTRAILIMREERLIMWDEDGSPKILGPHDEWVAWTPP